jgi:hypothetical protein
MVPPVVFIFQAIYREHVRSWSCGGGAGGALEPSIPLRYLRATPASLPAAPMLRYLHPACTRPSCRRSIYSVDCNPACPSHPQCTPAMFLIPPLSRAASSRSPLVFPCVARAASCNTQPLGTALGTALPYSPPAWQSQSRELSGPHTSAESACSAPTCRRERTRDQRPE